MFSSSTICILKKLISTSFNCRCSLQPEGGLPRIHPSTPSRRARAKTRCRSPQVNGPSKTSSSSEDVSFRTCGTVTNDSIIKHWMLPSFENSITHQDMLISYHSITMYRFIWSSSIRRLSDVLARRCLCILEIAAARHCNWTLNRQVPAKHCKHQRYQLQSHHNNGQVS